jgi:hypothetical protein
VRVSILKKEILKEIPSASAIEMVDGVIYIVGDDSKYLYVLNHELRLINKVEMHEPGPTSGRIPKHIKYDLECITSFKINGYSHLLVMGSGSKSPQRENAFLIKLPTRYNKKFLVWERNLSDFYQFISKWTGADGVINIEGVAQDEKHLFLLDRQTNQVLIISLEEFIEYIQQHSEAIPFPAFKKYDIPLMDGVPLQFTGACVFDRKLFFTASAEDTDNPVDDGLVKGSVIGCLSIQEEAHRFDKTILLSNEFSLSEVIREDKNYLLKIESLVVYECYDQNKYIGLAVSDDDRGGSEIMMLDIHL